MSTKIYKINEQIEAIGTKSNKILRDFFHNSREDNVFVYYSKTELQTLTDQEIDEYINCCEKLSTKTKLHIFTGRLQSRQTIDCGDSLLLCAGSILEQKIISLFLTRSAIQKVGYFDERLTDNCAYGDYVHRLSDANLHPKLDTKYLPWLFDVSMPQKTVSKNIMEELSCGWFNYKYKDFPQNKKYQEVAELKNSLKEYIKSSKV